MHAAYIARQGRYSGRARYQDLVSTGCGNMPAWAECNPARFWSAADDWERANGATYREIVVALPRELDPVQRVALLQDFIQQELGDRHAYQWAIHCPKAALEGGDQPHGHVMYSERIANDGVPREPELYFKRYNAKKPERGGCRKDSAGTLERLLSTRQRWARVQNSYLERLGHAARVDARSYADRGVAAIPGRHLGPVSASRLRRGKLSRRAVALAEHQIVTQAAQRPISELREEARLIELELAMLTNGPFGEATALLAKARRNAAREKTELSTKERDHGLPNIR
ncbi:MobA/MobL family protein [Paracidovorax konjaci]